MNLNLMPHEWKSERAKLREPLFGSGAAGWGMWMAGFTLASVAGYWLRKL